MTSSTRHRHRRRRHQRLLRPPPGPLTVGGVAVGRRRTRSSTKISPITSRRRSTSSAARSPARPHGGRHGTVGCARLVAGRRRRRSRAKIWPTTSRRRSTSSAALSSAQNGKCKTCSWAEEEKLENKDFAHYQSQAEYELCSTLSCAAAWKKSWRNGMCKHCCWALEENLGRTESGHPVAEVAAERGRPATTAKRWVRIFLVQSCFVFSLGVSILRSSLFCLGLRFQHSAVWRAILFRRAAVVSLQPSSSCPLSKFVLSSMPCLQSSFFWHLMSCFIFRRGAPPWHLRLPPVTSGAERV